ncbi:MAG: hypothetical protein Q9209_001084 [Squamulea sp. 1 TL-2023]
MLISQLEFLGKGIETKRFNTTRQKTWKLPVINISTLGGDRPSDQQSESTTPIVHSTFHDILAQKPCSSTSIWEFGAVHVPQSSVPPTPSPRQSLSTNPLAQPADVTPFGFPFDGTVLDSVDEHKVQEQILDLQKRIEQEQALVKEEQESLKARQQKIHDLQQDIQLNQFILDFVPGPVGTKTRNIVDQENSSLNRIGDDVNADSPSATTLVEPAPDLTFSSQSSHSPLEQPVYDGSKFLDSYDGQASDDVQMEDSMPEPECKSKCQSLTGAKKRKPFPLLSTPKKVCTDSNGLYHNSLAAFNASNSTNLLNTDGSKDGVGDEPTVWVRPEDASVHAPTTRPTSWPRSRIFRRSAGISVRKITEIFEKLRLPQNNSSAAAA